MLAGCLGGSDGDELHVLTDLSSDEWQEYWNDELVPGFEEEHDLSVDLEYTGLDEVGRQRLATLMQAQDQPAIVYEWGMDELERRFEEVKESANY